MKKIFKKVVPAVMAIVVATAFVFVPQVETAHADSFNTVKYKSKITVTTGDPSIDLDMGKKVKSSAKVTVKSSKKSVIEPFYESGHVYLSVKKKGKAKITIKNKSTKKTYKCTVKVIKYKNPFKKFKVGKLNGAKTFKTWSTGMMKSTPAKGTKAKVTIKAKKGWKVKKITLVSSKFNSSNGSFKTVTKNVKNKSTITYKGGSWDQRLFVKMYNKKHKMNEEFTLCLTKVY